MVMENKDRTQMSILNSNWSKENKKTPTVLKRIMWVFFPFTDSQTDVFCYL